MAQSTNPPLMCVNTRLYSASSLFTNAAYLLVDFRYSLTMSRLPPMMASTVVILESQVMTGLMSLPSMLVASTAPQTVCPAGDTSMLCSHTAAVARLTRNRGKVEQGVTMWVCCTFWELMDSIPQSEQQSMLSELLLAGPVTEANMPQMCWSTECQVLAFQLLIWILWQISTSRQGMNKFFHCSCALNQYPRSTVMLLLADTDTQSTDCNFLRLSTHMTSAQAAVKPVSSGKSVTIQAKSSPSQGSSRQQLSLLVQVFWSTGSVGSRMLATARILPVVSLKKIFLAFRSISFQVMLSHLSRSQGCMSACLVFQAYDRAKAAQNSSALSRAGTRALKSLVGTGAVPLRNTQGRQPAEPGYRRQYSQRVCVFLATSPNTSPQVQTSCLPVSSTLAKMPTWMDSLLLAVQQCSPPGSNSPVLMSSLQPSQVSPVDSCTPTALMNLVSQCRNYCRKGSGSRAICWAVQ